MKNKEDEYESKKVPHDHKRIWKYSILIISIAALFYITGPMLIANLLVLGLVIYLLLKYAMVYLIHQFQRKILPEIMSTYKKGLTYLLKGNRSYLLIGSTIILFFLTFVLDFNNLIGKDTLSLI